MAMTDMACHYVGEPITLKQIATRQNIALNYLEQIFLNLKRHDLVTSVKGPGGGYLLARKAAAITIDQILLAMNKDFHLTRCNKEDKLGCMPSNVKCMTHSLWNDLGDNILNYLSAISLADVVSRKRNEANIF